MEITTAKTFTAPRPWGNKEVARFGDIGVRIHWTDQPYIWHENDGDEVFVVLDGAVTMQVRMDGTEKNIEMLPGDILSIKEGEEHRAIPTPEARILVIEKMDSV
ncbi:MULTISPECIES: cupin domain-containing protein [Kordiimonas]|jgi:mannose-6-phosphate isomerase-like protein (cupin superfamily)|uniref:cupin domain-containing protein n=1 Tax=Kordiimonas TaxID=288021 RepID=UPI00257A9646|nr:cupin domain-containing protein [Kordiimonas sp. UBA4487]